MSYRKSEMLKKFQHDTNIAKVSIFDYGLWVGWGWTLGVNGLGSYLCLTQEAPLSYNHPSKGFFMAILQ